MDKKVSQMLKADLNKNVIVEKGGAWLLHITVTEEDTTITDSFTAWANPSAAKRYLKQFVIRFTPRKSIKMVVQATTPLGKPSHLTGELTYKVDERA